MGTGNHNPGEAYKTICTHASSGFATCEGDGLTATAENDDGYFKAGSEYVWLASPVTPKHHLGEDSPGSQPDR